MAESCRFQRRANQSGKSAGHQGLVRRNGRGQRGRNSAKKSLPNGIICVRWLKFTGRTLVDVEGIGAKFDDSKPLTNYRHHGALKNYHISSLPLLGKYAQKFRLPRAKVARSPGTDRFDPSTGNVQHWFYQ